MTDSLTLTPHQDTPAPASTAPQRPDPIVNFVTPQGANSVATARSSGALTAVSAAAAAAALAACGGGHVATPGPTATVQAADLRGGGGTEPARPAAAQRPSAVDAARFLTQASFGPRSVDEIEALRAEGYEHWLWAQFNAPTMLHTSYLDWQRQRDAKLRANADLSYEAIWQQWLGGNDPLRARMSFALSQILVISNVAPDLPAYALSSYMDMLNRHAFGNYRDLLEAVTLHPAMGRFLNLQGSEKANTSTGAHPNENYAREFLQLFTIGLVQLSPDGTVRTDAAGQPLPTYDETIVQGHARAFTGWTFALASSFHNADDGDEANWTTPMRSWPDFHSSGELKLVGGRTVTASTPEADLKAGIDAAFQHPNVGPFIGRLLIMRLVASNPSAAYVGRVAAAFDNNGAGVRGDLRAVLRAILLDPEARDLTLRRSAGAGKLREPVLRLATTLRALGATTPGGRNSIHELDSTDSSVGQSPLLAPTVFNFYSPSYKPAGAIATAGLVAPELQIATEASVAASLNFLRRVLTGGGIGGGDGRVTIKLDALQDLAGTPAALVDRIDALWCCGQMSASTRQRLLDLVGAIAASKPRDRVLAALTLTLLSPDHLVQG
ncbi:MAG: hypothetical protein RL375_356 [Pseudomonadota bacterium]|jgi:uncharacterized protein (DUF1800 family)